MVPRIFGLFLVCTALVALAVLATPTLVEAHRSGCHRWHSCPSDSGSYTCGDLGYTSQCGGTPVPLAGPTRHYRRSKASYPREVPLRSRPRVSWTTHDIVSSFNEYWNQSGGLGVFGYAKTPLYAEEDGRLAQIFERNRLEYHPENDVPYDIELGLLGDTRLRQLGRDWQAEPKGAPQSGCRYFAETEHNICGAFLAYWVSNGIEFDGRAGFTEDESLALFGYPITEATVEKGSDGQERMTQWFQRARMEDHGPQGIMLGLLGNEVFGE